MLETVWADLAKGLLAGGASLAVQWLVPTLLALVRRAQARRAARGTDRVPGAAKACADTTGTKSVGRQTRPWLLRQVASRKVPHERKQEDEAAAGAGQDAGVAFAPRPDRAQLGEESAGQR